jgi:tetratricopeptide (TPR) repeat protein
MSVLRASVIGFAVALAVPVLARERPQAVTPDWRVWVDLVNRHVPGAVDDSVREVALWPRDDLRRIIQDLPRASGLDLEPTVARGLVLHTDIAISHRSELGYALPAGGRATARLADGHDIGSASGTYQWEIGRALLAVLPPGSARLAIGRQWYRATAGILQAWGEYPELVAHLDAALDEIDDDPVLRLYEGTLHQAYAGPLVQQFVRDQQASARQESALPNPMSPMVQLSRVSRATAPAGRDQPQSAEAERRLAERALRRALDADPGLTEARVRLAHVLADRGAHDEARRELARALAVPLPRFLEYYARLLVGRETAFKGEFDAANQAFERAAALYPRAQAPLLGQSQVAAARGHLAAARAVLTRLANGQGRSIEDDPWPWIDRVHEPQAAILLEQMRTDLTR